MGASASSPTKSGIVTVNANRGEAAGAPSPRLDPDVAALQRLPPVTPLVPLPSPTLAGFFGGGPDPPLPSLHGRNASALCREYAALSRHAALPICEEQRALAKKMSGVEALCARVLYLMALRSSELTSSASTLRQLAELRARADEVHDAMGRALVRADKLEARASQLALRQHGQQMQR